MRRGIKLSERSPKLVIAKMAAASRTANKNQQKSTNKTSNSSDACWERALVVSVAAIAVANSHNQDRQSHVTNLYVFTQVKGNFNTVHGPISYCQDGHCLQSGQQESVEKQQKDPSLLWCFGWLAEALIWTHTKHSKGETEVRFIAENMSFKEQGLASPIVL